MKKQPKRKKNTIRRNNKNNKVAKPYIVRPGFVGSLGMVFQLPCSEGYSPVVLCMCGESGGVALVCLAEFNRWRDPVDLGEEDCTKIPQSLLLELFGSIALNCAESKEVKYLGMFDEVYQRRNK